MGGIKLRKDHWITITGEISRVSTENRSIFNSIDEELEIDL